MNFLKNEYVHNCIAHPIGYFMSVVGLKEQRERILNVTRPEKTEHLLESIEEIQKKLNEMLNVIDTCLGTLKQTSDDLTETLESDDG